jgi:probable DNA repair protein
MNAYDYPDLFRSLLDSMGWPGQRDINSVEYQSVKAFDNVLIRFSELSTVKQYSSVSDVLAYLKRITFEMLFQPQTPDTPIDILGVLEAEGLAYEHMWFLGAHDEAWPSKSKSNPLLPISVQRKHNIARSSPEREYEFARLITQSLIGCAKNVIVSYPAVIDELYQRPSPFFTDVKEVPVDYVTSSPVLFSEALIGTAPMEIANDTLAPVIPDDDIIEGGVSVIKHQASCPFRAFAQHRLGAVVNNGGEFTLSNAERGDLMHRALELIWKKLLHQSSLLELSEESRLALIEESANKALDEMAEHKDCLESPVYRSLELDRITNLSLQWLESDAKRAPFINVVTEKRSTVTIGGINIRVRIDRQDTLEDGSIALTDYKSTSPSTSALFGDRPDEPQLPIYAVTRPNRQVIGAVMFGQFKAGESGYKGIAQDAGVISKKSKAFTESREAAHVDQWESIVPAWGDTIQAIAASFKAGDASVSPKSKTSCDYCQLSSLCRVNEKRALARFQTDDNLIVRTA